MSHLKKETKRELFDIWVCQKEPFEQLYIKNTIFVSWEQIEFACTAANTAIPKRKI